MAGLGDIREGGREKGRERGEGQEGVRETDGDTDTQAGKRAERQILVVGVTKE